MKEFNERQLTLNKIASEVVISGWLEYWCFKLSSDKQLMKDLVQDIVIAILEYPNDTIIKLYNEGKHFNLIRQMIKNNYNSKTSKFYYTYRKNPTQDLEYVLKVEASPND